MPDLYYADGRNADGSLNLKRTREKKDLSFGKDVYSARSYYWELTGNYNRTFGEHRIGGLVLFYLQSNSNSDANDNLAAIPTRYESLSGRVTYGFKDTYFAEFSNLGLKDVPISEDYPSQYDRLLCGGIWCMVSLDYEYNEEDRKGSPIKIRNLKPIQMPHVDIKDLKEKA